MSNLSVEQLYSVYLAVARADWLWRRRAVYGATTPPPGHAEFRPLAFPVFKLRMDTVASVLRGDTILRERLSRQASAYGIDIASAMTIQSQAA
ncbi:hypothetical protein [Rubripirellula lacrimiformis]|uniref:hypothetical protein n=1 Tax=Rubripirellula lacrimiformis TaxID=1930273 RepID=UPI0011A18FC3|nr:hypothetical protein [Rubripirellula lacrimiformis]